MRREDILNKFTYHSPKDHQMARMAEIRTAALEFAFLIDNRVQDGPDKAAAIRKLRECVMTANAAIVLEAES